MKWLGILLVAPFWGMISTQLFLQFWLSFANLIITAVGFVKGAAPRKDNALGMGIHIASVILFGCLLFLGFWVLTDVLPFGRTRTENVIYWIFAAFSALYMLSQIPQKIRRSWKIAMSPGALEADILEQRMSAGPGQERPGSMREVTK